MSGVGPSANGSFPNRSCEDAKYDMRNVRNLTKILENGLKKLFSGSEKSELGTVCSTCLGPFHNRAAHCAARLWNGP